MTLKDLIVEVRPVDSDCTLWCYVNGHDACALDARNMFECLLAYARREGRAGLH